MQTNTKTTKKPVTWHIATNHLNLAYMTSIGMVPPISFLGNKYYHDCLAWFGDYIPLFNTVPQNIHEYNIDEDKRILKPCVLTLKKILLMIWIKDKSKSCQLLLTVLGK